jgi:DNA-binding CsgD family transcriptional regulator
LGSTLGVLLSPLAHRDGEVWRTTVARRIRDLIGATQAVFVVEQADAMRMYGVDMDWSTIRAYQSHYCSVDRGMALQRKTGIELWSRRTLWNPDVLARSEYYNEFALPNQLHDTVGLATTIRGSGTQIRIALFNDRSGSAARLTERQLGLLALILQAFKSGMLLHLRWSPRRAQLLEALDDWRDPLAVCDANGRVLHENIALTRTLPKKRPDDVVEAIREVARGVSAAARAGAVDGSFARQVCAAGDRYDMRGGNAGAELGAFGATALVSVTRHSASPAAATAYGEDARAKTEYLQPHDQELRAAYGLTRREVDVTRLLVQRRSNAEVAQALTISEHTARHHTESVLLKLGVRSRKDVETVIFNSLQLGAERADATRNAGISRVSDLGPDDTLPHTRPAY